MYLGWTSPSHQTKSQQVGHGSRQIRSLPLVTTQLMESSDRSYDATKLSWICICTHVSRLPVLVTYTETHVHGYSTDEPSCMNFKFRFRVIKWFRIWQLPWIFDRKIIQQLILSSTLIMVMREYIFARSDIHIRAMIWMGTFKYIYTCKYHENACDFALRLDFGWLIICSDAVRSNHYQNYVYRNTLSRGRNSKEGAYVQNQNYLVSEGLNV